MVNKTEKYEDSIEQLFKNSTLKMNLGCGADYRKGWLNVDADENVKSDVVWTLGNSPFPSKKEKFDGILCSHVLEHVPDLKNAKKELHRLLTPNGLLMVVVPNYLSLDAWGDDTHCRAFSMHSFMPGFWPGFAVSKTGSLHLVKAEDGMSNELLWLVFTVRKEK